MLDTLGSFIIGGLLLLNLLGLNFTLSSHNQALSSGHISQSTADQLMVVIQDDFRKIGYKVSNQVPILRFDSTQVVFLGDLNDDGAVDLVVYRQSDTTAVPQTPNPHDRYLYRDVNGMSRKIALGVVRFWLAGYTELGQKTTTLQNIRTIEVALEVEATDPIGDAYNRAIRRARISPVALQSK